MLVDKEEYMEIIDEARIANREEMLKEACMRIKALPIERGPKVDFLVFDRVMVSERASCDGKTVGAHRYLNQEEYDAVCEVEKDGCMVYYAMTADTSFGKLLELFYVSKYADDWDYERQTLAAGRPDVACVNLTGGFVDIGMVGFRPTEFGLIRTM